MSRFTKTIIEGTLAIMSLYTVGRLAFKAGYDVAKAEARVEELQKTSVWTPIETEEDTKKAKRVKIFDTLFKGKEVHVSVKPTKNA